MQGYVKTEEELAFEKKVIKFFMIHHVFYSKNYGAEVNEFSKPDFFVCMHGRFLGVEIENYTPNENGEKPALSQKIIDWLRNNKGGFMTVSPDTFEQFQKDFINAIIIMKKNKSFDDKIKAGVRKPTPPKPQQQQQPKKQFIVEVKKKPLFQKKTDAFYQNRYSQSIEKKSRFS